MKMSPILDPRFLTKTQRQILMERFQAKKNLTKGERRELAMSLNVDEEKIHRWYFNTRTYQNKVKHQSERRVKTNNLH